MATQSFDHSKLTIQPGTTFTLDGGIVRTVGAVAFAAAFLLFRRFLSIDDELIRVDVEQLQFLTGVHVQHDREVRGPAK